jgi:hypothetical protein
LKQNFDTLIIVVKKIVTTAFFLILPLLFLAPMNVVSASCSLITASSCPAGQWLCYTIHTTPPPRNPGGGVTKVCCGITQSDCTTTAIPTNATTPATPQQTSSGTVSESACETISDATQKAACNTCAAENNNTGVWTAIGCITTDPNDLLGTILRLGLGLAGGIAFLLILFGGLQIMTSAGNPEQLNAGRELVTSAIIGLILVLFSIFLLQFIGVTIIGIPGFVSQ